MTTTTFTLTVQAVNNSLPSYLAGKANYEWVAVAFATGEKQSDVLAAVQYTGNNNYDAWTGACVAHERREMLKVCGFGHGDGFDNAAYAINLGHDSPKWIRLNTPSDGADVQPFTTNTIIPSPQADYNAYNDGRSCAMHHGGEIQYHNGRVWFVAQTACYNWSTQRWAAVSWDRSLAGSGEIAVNDPRYPITYAAESSAGGSSAGFWRGHGGNFYAFGNAGFHHSAIYGDYVYGIASSPNTHAWWKIDTRAGVAEADRVTAYRDNTYVAFNSARWAASCEDLGIIVCGGNASVGQVDKAFVLNASANTWTNYTMSGAAPPFSTDAYQPVYIEADHTLLFYSARDFADNKIYRLQIPTSGGVFDPGGTFSWLSPIQATGANPYIGVIGGAYQYGKFNKLNDVGGGQAVMVCAPLRSAATFVCKIPSA